MIPQSFIQELIDRLDIIDVIGGYLSLKKRGANYLAKCPFHNEKTPSFTVFPEKNNYHCFGCGAHGNVISFLMQYQGITFPEAVEELAGSVGLVVPSTRVDSQHLPSNRKDIDTVLSIATKYYEQQLKESEMAINFLKNRGLTGSIAKLFNLGFSPNTPNGLRSVFDDYDKNEHLLEAGLVIRKDRNQIYDRFRGRIMFPIHNAFGKVVGFGGRAVDDVNPKYLNSPETSAFNKGQELYGLFQSKDGIRKSDKIIVVEGYMDVVAMSQFGIRCAVATLGTATSQFQVKKLLSRADNVIFAFDGDKAGRKAAWRAMLASLPMIDDGKLISFMFFPDGEDPDSFIRQHGAPAFWKHVEAAEPLSEFLLREANYAVNLESTEGKAKYLKEVKNLISKIKAPNLFLLMQKKVAQLVGVSVDELALGQRKRLQRTIVTNSDSTKPRVISKILSIMCSRPNLAKSCNLSQLVDFEGCRRQVASKDEWDLIDYLVKISAENKEEDLLEKFRGSNTEALVVKAQSDAYTMDTLSNQEMEVELRGAWGKLIDQLKSVRVSQLLNKKALSSAEKQELMHLQRRHQ